MVLLYDDNVTECCYSNRNNLLNRGREQMGSDGDYQRKQTTKDS